MNQGSWGRWGRGGAWHGGEQVAEQQGIGMFQGQMPASPCTSTTSASATMSLWRAGAASNPPTWASSWCTATTRLVSPAGCCLGCDGTFFSPRPLWGPLCEAPAPTARMPHQPPQDVPQEGLRAVGGGTDKGRESKTGGVRGLQVGRRSSFGIVRSVPREVPRGPRKMAEHRPGLRSSRNCDTVLEMGCPWPLHTGFFG